MKSGRYAAWLVGLLISGLGMTGCGGDVPFSPEEESTEVTTAAPNSLTRVGTALGDFQESPLAGVSIHGNYAYVGGMSVGYTRGPST